MITHINNQWQVTPSDSVVQINWIGAVNRIGGAIQTLTLISVPPVSGHVEDAKRLAPAPQDPCVVTLPNGNWQSPTSSDGHTFTKGDILTGGTVLTFLVDGMVGVPAIWNRYDKVV